MQEKFFKNSIGENISQKFHDDWAVKDFSSNVALRFERVRAEKLDLDDFIAGT